ncbi:hypothetical protein GUITHDRAFT_150044 [Guillardia theta CCMP2712]|uniref:LIM zinc-binding domain-containing protein n=1 Tax=Guillardia theta (strain CCMP2712) TaxID=905079 RepID=L1K1Q8_GUITC|nr:hypothetical protein GUITHDRAFT_150044 [Guillardia theta CCMP2712]EKX54552.1 hypothetical protein GUITHDRAFT_150044 [Guillardia theta CCMP2712]|eukprot:XP_005841532.1 hypothetical protein GUITHDRAFT_150044 [Guillardia theta CCMP2712]
MHKDCYDQRNEIMMRLREGGDSNVQNSNALDAGQNFEYRGLCGVCGHEVYTNQLRVGQEGKYFHKSCFDEVASKTPEQNQPISDARKDEEYFV